MDKNNPLSKLSREYRLLIEDAYKAGKTPEQIGIEYGLDFEEVKSFCDSVKATESRYEKLCALIEELESVLDKVKDNIDQTGAQQAMYLQSYQKLVNEYRVALGELDDLKRPEDIVKEIMERVLNPFVIELVKVCTEESNKLKQELTKRDVPAHDSSMIATDLFKRLGDRIKSTMPEAQKTLSSYYGVSTEQAPANVREKMLQ